jgi:hypothetical protein
MTVQPSALAAITAALTGGKPAQPAIVTPATLPVQSAPFAFAFVPQAAQPALGAAVSPPSNPFQPSPIQAQTAFVAAVPRAAEQHSHPVTGVPFAPINPPGEASSAPTVGLDATPLVGRTDFASSGQADVHDANGTVVGPHGTPQPTPKAHRARKPRASAASASAISEPMVAGVPLSAGDGAADVAAASVGPSGEARAFGSPRDARPTLQDLADFDQALNNTSTEVLVQELSERGWTVSLSK